MTPAVYKKSWFPLVFEILIWITYVCLFKYSYFLEAANLPNPGFDNFPYPELSVYALAMTMYIIPFYRWIMPRLLLQKKYGWLFLVLLVYFWTGLKISNYLVTGLFNMLHDPSPLAGFYTKQHSMAAARLFTLFGWSPNTPLPDLVVFMSVGFVRYAFQNEQKKRLLERDNLILQLESLKAQLHPHFLFNTLNSIYGMSLTGHPDTSDYILRLSDMMRFILYDCQQNSVPLEKDLEFLQNYIDMEKKRYPDAGIQFSISGDAAGKHIAPLLFIPFVENSFKHGAHRIKDKGFIDGSLQVHERQIVFHLKNDFFPSAAGVLLPASGFGGQKAKEATAVQYGGVGIENVKKRLLLYYPGRHTLQIHRDNNTFEIELTINL